MPTKVPAKAIAISPTIKSKVRRVLNGIPTASSSAANTGGIKNVGNGKAKAATPAKLPLQQARSKVAKYTYKMPKFEHDVVVALKGKLNEQGIKVKKSELIRAGIQLLAGLSDARIKASLQKILAGTVRSGKTV